MSESWVIGERETKEKERNGEICKVNWFCICEPKLSCIKTANNYVRDAIQSKVS